MNDIRKICSVMRKEYLLPIFTHWNKKREKEQMEDQSLRSSKSLMVEQVFPAACGEPRQPWRIMKGSGSREEV